METQPAHEYRNGIRKMTKAAEQEGTSPDERAWLQWMVAFATLISSYAYVPNGPAEGLRYVLPYAGTQFFVPMSAVVSLAKKVTELPDGEALGEVLASTEPEDWTKYCDPDRLLQLKGKEGTCVYTTFAVVGHPDQARILRRVPDEVAEHAFPKWKRNLAWVKPMSERHRVRLAVLDWTKAKDCPLAAELSPRENGWPEVDEGSAVKSCAIELDEEQVEAEAALIELVQSYAYHTGETQPKKIFLPSLLEATRAPVIEQLARTIDAEVGLPLDATSSRKDLKIVCKAVAKRLRSKWASKKFDAHYHLQKKDLARRLRFPSRALLDALAKELGAVGGGGGAARGAAAGGGAAEAALAQQRTEIAGRMIVPTDEMGKSACLLLLDLFVDIRGANPDVSAASELEPLNPAGQLSPSSA